MTAEHSPTRPRQVDPRARASLEALSASGMGGSLSLGGPFAIAHYHQYRATHDVDAWWMRDANASDRDACVRIVENALAGFGKVRTRSWGDVVSVELTLEGHTVFSIKIASRSAMLSDPVASPWPGVRIDVLDELLAAKMVALVERGAPRDFVDVYRLCQDGLYSPARCWELWSRRQDMAGASSERARANLAVRSHLARIERARPLSTIEDSKDRSAAQRTRTWFVEELLGVPGR